MTVITPVIETSALGWKSDWASARRALTDWWEHRGLALHVIAPRDEPVEDILAPPSPGSLEATRTDPLYRADADIYRMSRTFYGGAAFPMFNADVGGPGSLGLFLGANGHVAETTVWYEPCIVDPESHPPLRLDKESRWWRVHMDVIDEGLRRANGRYLVGCPDLIENIDTLAQLRGTQKVLMDLIERPDWVVEKISEINQAYFDCFDAYWPRLRDPSGGSAFYAFQLWGPGRTAKVQCDLSCMISPAMFRRFVRPALADQCRWLDYAMYHLDGTQALPQLDNLLEIDSLQAIEWTPQAGLPRGGDPMWYDLYRRIKAAGKSVQAIEVAYEEVEPLIDAVGPEGLMILTDAPTESAARRLLDRIGWKEL